MVYAPGSIMEDIQKVDLRLVFPTTPTNSNSLTARPPQFGHSLSEGSMYKVESRESERKTLVLSWLESAECK